MSISVFGKMVDPKGGKEKVPAPLPRPYADNRTTPLRTAVKNEGGAYDIRLE